MSIIYQPKGKAAEFSKYAANLYRGCSHGCVYCYVPNAIHCDSNTFHSAGYIQPRKNVLVQLKKDCGKYAGKLDSNVLLSFSSDPYQPIESETRLTRVALKIFSDHNINVTVLTKGGTRACCDFDLLGKPGNEFACTITSIDSKISEKYEPYAAEPDDRIEALKIAHKRGIRTWVSLEPCFNQEQSIQVIEKTHKYTDLYKVGKLNYHADARKIDWKGYLDRVTFTLQEYGKKYIIKNDLAQAARSTAA